MSRILQMVRLSLSQCSRSLFKMFYKNSINIFFFIYKRSASLECITNGLVVLIFLDLSYCANEMSGFPSRGRRGRPRKSHFGNHNAQATRPMRTTRTSLSSYAQSEDDASGTAIVIFFFCVVLSLCRMSLAKLNDT